MNDGRSVWVWVLVVLGGIATLSVIHFLIASLAPALFCGAAEPAPWSLSGRGGLSAQACSEIVRNYSWAAAGSFAGLVALVALYFNAQRTGTDRQRLTNDTYVKAIEQLASDSVEVRIGAMYALEQIARENQRYHWPIMETLAAYVRERAPWPPKDKQAKGLDAVARSIERVGEAVAGGFPPPAAPAGEGPEAEGGTEPAEGGSAEERKQPPTDIQTALTIIATRPAYRRERHPGWLRRQAPKVAARLKRWKEAQFTRSEPVYRAVDRAIAWLGAVGQSPRRLEPRRIDLHGTDLRGAALLRAALSHADLRGANLMHANLFGANLEGADLQDADLQDADLFGAKLWGAHLRRANLVDAYLVRANLFGANLEVANLVDANLRGADLGGAKLWGAKLWGAYLVGAKLWGAKLRGAELIGAKFSKHPKALGAHWPDDRPPRGLDEIVIISEAEE